MSPQMQLSKTFCFSLMIFSNSPVHMIAKKLLLNCTKLDRLSSWRFWVTLGIYSSSREFHIAQ